MLQQPTIAAGCLCLSQRGSKLRFSLSRCMLPWMQTRSHMSRMLCALSSQPPSMTEFESCEEAACTYDPLRVNLKFILPSNRSLL